MERRAPPAWIDRFGRGVLEHERDGRRINLHDLDAERRPHLIRREMVQALAWLRVVQIDDRNDV